MKTSLIIVGFLAANIIAFWCLAHHYEFHTGMNGQMIWRCNNFTGKVEYGFPVQNTWIEISSPKQQTLPNFKSSSHPFVPPPLNSKGQSADEFFDSTNSKPFVPPATDEIIKPAKNSPPK